jgi:hypothetical protein
VVLAVDVDLAARRDREHEPCRAARRLPGYFRCRLHG